MTTTPTVATLIAECLALERAGQFAVALARAQETLAIAHETQQAEAVADALICVARFRFRLGQEAQAKALAQEALRLSGAETAARAGALLMLGMCAAETDALAESELHYRQAYELARVLGDHLLHFRALHNLAGGVYLPRGQFDLALVTDEEAYQVGVRHSLTDWLHFPLITIALNCQLTGRRARAREALARLDCAASTLPGSGARAYHELISASLDMDQGDLARASDRLARARAIVREAGDPPLSIEVRLATSRYYRLAGDAAAAWNWADDALTLAKRGGYRQRQGQCLCERARAAWQREDLAAATADLIAARTLLDPLDAAFDAACAAVLLAGVLHHQCSPAAAQVWIEAADRIITGGYAFLLQQEHPLVAPILAAYGDAGDPEVRSATTRLQAALDHLPPPPLRICALGGFQVLRGGIPISSTAGQRRKARQLLLYLLYRRQPVPRDELLEALWPDLPPDSAALALNTTFSDLRHILEPDLGRGAPSHYLERAGDTLALHFTEESWYDVWAFEEATRAGPASTQHALALYQGDFLPEEPYVEWVVRERERLRSLYLNTMIAWLEEQMAAKAWREGEALTRRILDLEPWLEEVWRARMTCLAGLGRRGEALLAYRACARELRTELDAAPSAETRRLYEQIKAA